MSNQVNYLKTSLDGSVREGDRFRDNDDIESNRQNWTVVHGAAYGQEGYALIDDDCSRISWGRGNTWTDFGNTLDDLAVEVRGWTRLTRKDATADVTTKEG